MRTTDAQRNAARFTKRLVIYEEPAMIERLERIAALNGRSTAAEVRFAIRWALQTTDREARQ
jgi:hypothetical protein